ncbi:MAG: glycosyltransferase family 2 protein [Anaerolineae bacterium]|nr:glycosyltransferase family 2 protein [Anaerolineae bacterium]MDW8068895.1 glycosyltransferase family 2 protein [Anaerolineae bacterium]
MIDLSVLIVNWNTKDVLADCLRALPEAIAPISSETIVVDNGSSDGSPEMVSAQFPWVRLIENRENAGFVHATNQAIAASRGAYLLLLNSDAIAPPGSLARMVSFMKAHPDAGAAAPKLVHPDGSFQASYARFPTLLSESLSAFGLNRRLWGPYHPSPPPRPNETPHPVDWAPGACLLLRRDVIEAVGPLDEGFWMYSEDTDLCYRIHRAGWKVYYLPDVAVIHLGGASSRQCRPESVARLYGSKVRFFRKHYGLLPAVLLSIAVAAAYAVKAGLAGLAYLSPRRREQARTQFRTSRLVWETTLSVLTGQKSQQSPAEENEDLPGFTAPVGLRPTPQLLPPDGKAKGVL